MSVNRRLVWMLVVAQLGPGLPVAEVLAQQASPAAASSPFSSASASASFDFAGMLASSSGPFSEQLPTDPPPPPTPRVKVNRTLPTVDPPKEGLQLSADPSDAEFFRARIFNEPLVPVGATAQPQEHAVLAAALHRYVDAKRPESVEPLLTFLQAFPSSRWRASLLANIGTVLYATGYFSKGIQNWDEAWRLAKDDTTVYGRGVAAYAVGEWLEAMSSFGRVAELRARLDELKGRDLGGSAGQKMAVAQEELGIFENAHHTAFSSGALALDVLRSAVKGKDNAGPTPAFLQDYHATPAGMSLVELNSLATRAGVPGRMVFRDVTSEPVVPAILHLRVGHYTTLVDAREGVYLLRDRILGDRWVSRQALDDEASGYQLVPNGAAAPSGWRVVEDVEARSVIGHCVPGIPRPDDAGDQCKWDSPCASGKCFGRGLAAYSFHPVTAGLRFTDVPLNYTPPRGPAVEFRLRYDHRASSTPQIATYGNIGSQWEFEWLAYVQELPQACSLTTCIQPRLDVSLPGPGVEQYLGSPDVTQDFGQHWRSRARLVRVSRTPIRYERRLPDGTVEVYGAADGASEGQRRVFLTAVSDPQGQQLQFTYDASFRLVAITDALGQVTTLAYGWPSDPLKITSVTDPFGRTATLTYTAAGQLATITDVIGLTSSFSYSSGDFIATEATPYGTTRFRAGARSIEATDPLGGTERLEYHQENTTLPVTLPTSEVPDGFAGFNTQMHRYNTFYWDKRAMALYPGDLSKATNTRWFLSANTGDFHPGAVSIPQSIKRPLESRVWFRYRGQPAGGAIEVGEGTIPTGEARLIAPGVTQLWQATVDAFGNVTSRTDPLGRRTSYDYASNGIDLLAVRQTTGTMNDVLASYTGYDSHHQPGTQVDAALQATTFTYNSAGQRLMLTNPKNETTSYSYDANGYLQSVTRPVSGATTTYTYDEYGRIRTITDSDGYVLTTDYDLFDRPVKTTYPDGTYEQTIYDKLDPARQRDRLGRWSYTFYDALRRIVATKDPLGNTIQRKWCACGSLDALIDGNGQQTKWERDAQARVTSEIRADGTTITSYTYENATSRLSTTTDPKGQIATYAYNLDNTIQQISYSNVSLPTATIAYTYDPAYRRVETMVDGTGVTTFSYKPVGALGAGRLFAVDGPLTNDTLTYGYDELARTTSRLVDGVGRTLSYDSLGRVSAETNPLGTFTYIYEGVSERLSSVSYPNGQVSTYEYFGNLGDHELKMLQHRLPDSTSLVRFDYTHDVGGNIRTFTQQSGVENPQVTDLTHDAADRLTSAVVRSVEPMPAVLKRYRYEYDAAGNRTTEQIDDTTRSSTVNKLNELVGTTPSGPLVFAGTLSEQGSVSVQGRAAVVDADRRFFGKAVVGEGTTRVPVSATDASGNTRTNEYDVTLSGDSQTLSWDANGNLLSDGQRTFEWDGRNQLVVVSVGTKRSEFQYDGLGRRVRTIERDSGIVVSDRRLVWCGLKPCEERDSGAGSIYRRFYSQGTQEQGVPYFHVTDHLGSIRALTDTTGAVRARYDYDPYGRARKISGDLDSSRTYTGHLAHDVSGLVLAPLRAYDPALGRWISQDPIGLFGGPNLYAYVDGRPMDWADATGLLAPGSWRIVLLIAMADGPEPGPADIAAVIVGVVLVLIPDGPHGEIGGAGDGEGGGAGGSGNGSGVGTGEETRQRKRGQGRPRLPSVNPGKDSCGNCKPCPPNGPVVEEAGNHHGSTSGYHYHQVVYNQNPKTCECFARELNGPTPENMR